jgi:ribosomal protein S18 acetylase RimI-like enzyme
VTDTTVRDATADDVPGIRRVARRAWTTTYEGHLSTETIETALREWYGAAELRRLLGRDDVEYLVAERDSRVVGYIGGGPVDDADATASLGAIYVDPDDWGRGIGTALLARFSDRCRAREVETIRVRVLAANAIGRSFYEKRGFEPVETVDAELFGESVRERVYRRRIE